MTGAGSVIGLIPARGGSKGLPRKNLVLLAGKPLIGWTIEAAQLARTIERVVVSTDSDEIAAVARAFGAEVLARPTQLAADDTPMLPVIADALDHLGACETLVLLQPTSPLRTEEHIDQAVDLLRLTGADAVVGVVEVPHRYMPSSLMRLEGDRVTALDPSAPVLRQEKERLFARNGPAVLALNARRLGDNGNLYGGDVRAYPMDALSSLDIDTSEDLVLVEAVIKAGSSPNIALRWTDVGIRG